MERWTLAVIRNRKKVLAAWLALFALGAWATSGLGDLLTNRFSIPGSDAERGRTLLKDAFNERTDGTFTLVFRATKGAASDPAFVGSARAATARGAAAVKGAKPGPLQQAGKKVAYARIATPLENADAANKTPALRKAIGDVKGGKTYLSGWPASEEDIKPIFEKDLMRGEKIAIPIALLVMAFMFGTVVGIAVPLLFALITIPATLGLVWIVAHYMTTPIHVQNIVTLIGLAIAIDYSMLIVFRYREELETQEDAREALMRTMATAGRTTFFSGMVVALGLAVLLFMPVPFMRAMGLGGLLVPLVSVAASATLLPAMLAVLGHRVNRLRFVPRSVLRKRAKLQAGFWTKLARSIMRRPLLYLTGSVALLAALIYPAAQLKLTAGDNRGLPKTTESARGLALLERTLGPGALAPNQIVVDTGRRNGAWSRRSIAAQRKLVASMRRDSEVGNRTIQAPALLVRAPGVPDRATLAKTRGANLVDSQGRVVQIRAGARSDNGTEAAMDLVDRLRDRHVPNAGFGPYQAFVTGGPAFGVDFIDKSYAAFPWLVLAVLALSYLLLLRAFRSLFLPLKAVFMNLLSVGATYGVLVLAFQDGWGGPFGLQTFPQVEAWIPIFLFAMLFGLSMDYEVFLLSRMREEWDARHDNEEAVARGLERTGRIITAAAIIMIAAFSGFTAGSFVGLQQFGLGLSAAILLDATIVRALLVPATMKLLGRWNWYLPESLRKVLRLPPARRRPVPEIGSQ